jgi:hypothetical protein
MFDVRNPLRISAYVGSRASASQGYGRFVRVLAASTDVIVQGESAAAELLNDLNRISQKRDNTDAKVLTSTVCWRSGEPVLKRVPPVRGALGDSHTSPREDKAHPRAGR